MALRSIFTLVVALALVAVAGCHRAPTPVGVAGEVTFDVAPLADGVIIFEPVAEGQQRDTPIHDGQFALPATEGLLPDLEFKVVIKGFKNTGRKYPNADMGASYEEVVQFVPAAYNSASTTRVRISRRESENQLSYALQSRGP